MFELNPDTRLFTDLLLKMQVGDVLTYTSMSEQMGRTINGSDPYLSSGRRRAEKETGYVFEFERKVGIRRLSDSEIVALGESGSRRIRRATRRVARKITNVGSFDALSPEDKARHNGALALLGAIAAASKASTLRRLEGASAKSNERLPLGRTFELFKE